MKEWNIQIRYVNGKLGAIIKLNFQEEAYDVLALIGELENLKQQQLDKLNNKKAIIKRGEDSEY